MASPLVTTGARTRGDNSKARQVVGRSKKIWIDRNDIIGSGGFGKVFSGKFNGRSVAVKRIMDGKYTSTEIRILEECKHPNIVLSLFHDEEDEFFYAVMERCDCDLKFFIGQCEEAVEDTLHRDSDIMFQTTSGLCYLHSKSIIHRDIKLGNILVNKTRHGLKVKITDFGISKILPKNMTSTSTVMSGTFGYRASEVLNGRRIRQKSDVFSLGIVFFKILCGVDENPFGNDIIRDDVNIQDKENPDFQKISHFRHARSFRELIESMIEHDTNYRLSSKEVSEEIEELCQKIREQ